jgi:dTDP-4-amino-4,6-dideoxygalactose transaminase
LCLFLVIAVLLTGSKAILQAGPLHRGRINGLKAKGVPTNIYYPKPLTEQTAYRRFPVAGNGVPVSARVAQEVVALPMHPDLDEETQDYIIASTREVLRNLRHAAAA